LAAFHRALAISDNLDLPAAVIRRFDFRLAAVRPVARLIFAHLAFCAALILAMAAALMCRLFGLPLRPTGT